MCMEGKTTIVRTISGFLNINYQRIIQEINCCESFRLLLFGELWVVANQPHDPTKHSRPAVVKLGFNQPLEGSACLLLYNFFNR